MNWQETVMNKDKLAKIHHAIPMTAKYSDVFLAIAKAQAEITGDIAYKAGEQQGRRKEAEELQNVADFAHRVAKVMEWDDAQAILTNIITVSESKLKERDKVMKWVEEHCLACRSNTPSNQEEYLGFSKTEWQAFKEKELRQEE